MARFSAFVNDTAGKTESGKLHLSAMEYGHMCSVPFFGLIPFDGFSMIIEVDGTISDGADHLPRAMAARRN